MPLILNQVYNSCTVRSQLSKKNFNYFMCNVKKIRFAIIDLN